MRANRETCIRISLRHEGGYVNDRRDPGGETNFGISKRSYPDEDIRAMTVGRAIKIYERDFWPKVRGDDLPSGVDLVALDGAINSGPRRSTLWLQTAVGLSGRSLDGRIGLDTLGAIRRRSPDDVVVASCAQRMGFLRGLRTWGTFGRGWSRRVADIEARGVAMARASLPNDARRDTLSADGTKARTAAKTDSRGATGSTAGGFGSLGGLNMADVPDWALWTVGVIALVLIVNFVGRARHNRNRAAAYNAAARGIAP